MRSLTGLMVMMLAIGCEAKDDDDDDDWDDARGDDSTSEPISIPDPSGLCGRFAYGQYTNVWMDFGDGDGWPSIDTYEGGWSVSAYDWEDGPTWNDSFDDHFVCNEAGILWGVTDTNRSEGDWVFSTTYAPPLLVWRHDADVGTTWTTSATPTTVWDINPDWNSGSADGGPPPDPSEVPEPEVGEPITLSYRIVEAQRLEIPAGVFDTLVMEYTTETGRAFYWWISEGLGLVALGGDPDRGPTRVLLEYGIE